MPLTPRDPGRTASTNCPTEEPEQAADVVRETVTAALQSLCPHGHPDFYAQLVEAAELHSAKNHDYAGDGDPLGNFHRVARMVEPIVGSKDGAAKVAVIYMAKQVDALIDMLGHGREAKAEGLDGRLIDISVYAQLIRILLREGGACHPACL